MSSGLAMVPLAVARLRCLVSFSGLGELMSLGSAMVALAERGFSAGVVAKYFHYHCHRCLTPKVV